MKNAFFVMVLMFCIGTNAASVYWKDFGLYNGATYGSAVEYNFHGSIYGENGEYAWFHTEMYGHVENGGFLLKHYDFSGEMMEPTFNWWALALYGDVISEATFTSLRPIELFYWPEPEDFGGTLVENPDDFYMAFKVSEVLVGDTGYEEGMSWYGWVHVSVDENLQMTLLDEGINLYGGAVMVGMGIPEPSGGMLLLIGVAVLGLRRVKKVKELKS